ncbi:amidohydrolase family protein [Kaarinaea lacus]
MLKNIFYNYYYTIIVTILIFSSQNIAASDLLLFDAHVHYSSDVWETIPPKRAINKLKRVGIRKAIVSSTPANGAVKLFNAKPDFVIPFLRPYRTSADRNNWYNNPEILEYVESNLKEFRYRGLGEFHLFGSQVGTPVMQGILKLAKENKLILMAHSNHETIDALIQAAPSLTIIWAHAGFDVDTRIISNKLKHYKNLYIELSFREGIMEEQVLSKQWFALFTTYPSRFLIGTDTYIPQRWLQLPDITQQYQKWLQQLPSDVAKAIAYENGIRLFQE